jgi:hypothetical protein
VNGRGHRFETNLLPALSSSPPSTHRPPRPSDVARVGLSGGRAAGQHSVGSTNAKNEPANST